MRRALQLARLGSMTVRRNPLVGSVIVADDRIIGEGYYRIEGGAHAEIQALRSVCAADRHLLSAATLYVSLEPCCIYGRTPPCTSAILEAGIPRVVISAVDATPGVNGGAIELLRSAGVQVKTGVRPRAGERLAAPRNVYVTEKRPYIVLKWAQSSDGRIGRADERVIISNPYTQRLTHRWRAENTAILVGTRTAALDRPRLDLRHYYGTSPTRVVLDRRATLPTDCPLFDGQQPTVLVAEAAPQLPAPAVTYWSLPFDDSLLPELLSRLADRQLATLLVEGGAFTAQQFIDADLWDEIRIFLAPHRLQTGTKAPRFSGRLRTERRIADNLLRVYERPARGG